MFHYDVKLHWVLGFLILFLIASLFYFGYIDLGFEIPLLPVLVLLFCAWIIVLYFGKTKKANVKDLQRSFGRFFLIALSRSLLAGVFLIVINAALLYFFKLDLNHNFFSLFLVMFIFLLLQVINSVYIGGRKPISTWDTVTNFSKASWIMLAIGIIGIICLFFYAQCYQFSLPFGATCFNKIFGIQ
jgi:hypothetical protein